jgi:hypothetical protein
MINEDHAQGGQKFRIALFYDPGCLLSRFLKPSFAGMNCARMHAAQMACEDEAQKLIHRVGSEEPGVFFLFCAVHMQTRLRAEGASWMDSMQILV